MAVGLLVTPFCNNLWMLLIFFWHHSSDRDRGALLWHCDGGCFPDYRGEKSGGGIRMYTGKRRNRGRIDVAHAPAFDGMEGHLRINARIQYTDPVYAAGSHLAGIQQKQKDKCSIA